MAPTFHVLTLGCPKNIADSESMSRLLEQSGHVAVPDARQADVVIVNTCGFIEAAIRESIQALQAAAKHKRRGQVLIAAGCLSELRAATLSGEIPTLDGVLGTRHWSEIGDLVDRLAGGPEDIAQKAPPLPLPSPAGQARRGGRRRLAPPEGGATGGPAVRPSAYLKISDGCDASCAFCVIPRIKGPYRSKPADEVLAEVGRLLDQGVREIVLVAQDTTLYGSDAGQRDGLAILVERILEAAPRLAWLRLMYCYPQHITPRLIRVMASSTQVCRYLDLPLQHAHPATLQRMGRPSNVDQARDLIARLRDAMPEIALRSSFIVGYPGETAGEFDALLRFLEEVRLDRAGFFTYSPEDGTAAAALPGQLPRRVKSARFRQAMEFQQGVSLAKNRTWVGKALDVLVEGVSQDPEPRLVVGRSFRDAPEVDGLVLARGVAELGSMVRVEITSASAYDLWGQLAAPG